MPITYRVATKADLPGMAEVYAAAFPESIGYFFPDGRVPVRAIADLLEVCLASEPQSAFVADDGRGIAGYCLAPAHLSRLSRVAINSGHLTRFLWRWLTGQYGLGLRALYLLALNKLAGHNDRRDDPHHSEAHILSIAIHPDFQGQGLGTCLLTLGLEYLESQSVERVRLEVRPDNLAAQSLYEKHGFEAVGHTSDNQGQWIIMLRPVAATERGAVKP